jgi:glycolate oxidase iron-sulfur subunit
LAEDSLPPVRGKVYLLEGCAMRVLFPNVHLATRRLLRRVGYEIEESSAGCCGALHAHQGLLSEGLDRLGEVAAAMPGDLPIVVDSAGCGSFMKDHGERLKGRVFDVSEFLLAEGLVAALCHAETLGRIASSSRSLESGDKPPQSRPRVAYHDACHLAHGQKVFREPRELLAAIPGIQMVDLPESDTCCGSAGIYNLTQPKMARALLERKWGHVVESGAEIVALGNPGCHAWIAQAARENGGRVRVVHTVELLEAAFSGIEGLTG